MAFLYDFRMFLVSVATRALCFSDDKDALHHLPGGFLPRPDHNSIPKSEAYSGLSGLSISESSLVFLVEVPGRLASSPLSPLSSVSSSTSLMS